MLSSAGQPDAAWVFLPRRHGVLLDNVKYLFTWASAVRGNCWFITPNPQVAEIVRAQGLAALPAQDAQAQALLRSAEHVFVDDVEFADYLPPAWWQGKSIIQLWHGSPLRKVGLPAAWSPQTTDVQERARLIERASGYRAVISASPLYNRIFTTAFQAEQVWMTGYPRTDVLLRQWQPADALFVDPAFNALQGLDRRIRLAVYAPAARVHGSALAGDDADWQLFDRFLRQHHVLLTVKLPAGDRHGMALFERHSFTNILALDPHSDVYPVLRLAHLLIADYSSLVADWLLLERPVVFFMPDHASYLRQSSGFFFDPLLRCPGEVTTSLAQLADAVARILEDGDAGYAGDRELVRRLCNSYQDGLACERILQVLADTAAGH